MKNVELSYENILKLLDLEDFESFSKKSNSCRQTGRTTRMLIDCLLRASSNIPVIVIGYNQDIARNIYSTLLKFAAKIGMSDQCFLGWSTPSDLKLKLRGLSRNIDLMFDHTVFDFCLKDSK